MRDLLMILGYLTSVYIEYRLFKPYIFSSDNHANLVFAIIFMLAGIDTFMLWHNWRYWPESTRNRRIKSLIYTGIFIVGMPTWIIAASFLASTTYAFIWIFLLSFVFLIGLMVSIYFLDKHLPDNPPPDIYSNLGDGI